MENPGGAILNENIVGGGAQIPASNDFTIAGVTTIIWGTSGMLPGAGNLSSYIVTGASYAERVEEIDIMQSTGFTAIVALLNDGHDIELTVIDDSAINPPATGTVVTLSSPYATSGIPMLKIADRGTAARKREGERVFSFKSYSAIAGLS